MAIAAGVGELAGGLLFALALLTPLATLALVVVMLAQTRSVATRSGVAGKA